MKAEITVIVNRIHFEDYQHGGDAPDATEIRLAWERAFTSVVEDARFTAEIEHRVGFNSAPQVIVTVESELSDCDIEAEHELADFVSFVERYGKDIADKALDAAISAAHDRAKELGVGDE
jgi:hypothetical protein